MRYDLTMINISVEKNPNEATVAFIRRFSRKVQASNILKKAKALRAYNRPQSKVLERRRALRYQEKRKKIRLLIKLGKMPDNLNRK